MPQVGQASEFGRDRTAQVVVGQVQTLQAGEVTQLRRDGACQVVLPEGQRLQVGEVLEFGRDRPGQVIVVQVQGCQADEVFHRCGNPAGQLVVPEKKPLEVGEIAEFGWDRAVQVVAAQGQQLEIGEVPEFGGDRAVESSRPPSGPAPRRFSGCRGRGCRQLDEIGRRIGTRIKPACGRRAVVTKVQDAHALQEPELRRDSAREAVGAETQARDVSIGTHLHAVPLAERAIRQPVALVDPVRATGGFIERR